MNTIEIKYYPLPLVPWQRSAKGTHPENWEEVTPAQLVAIIKSFRGEIETNAFLHTMTGISRRILSRLAPFHIYNLENLLSFFSDKKPYNTFIIKSITLSGKTFFAPQPKLKKMSFGQFIFADTHFGNYNSKNEKSEASRFLSALYLPAKTGFSEDLIEQNAVFDKTSPVLLEAVIINYLLIKEWLVQIYPLVFDTDNDEKKLDKELKKPKAPRDPMAWVKIFEILVGDDLINQDKWAEMPVHNIFRFMSKKIKENMKRKK